MSVASAANPVSGPAKATDEDRAMAAMVHACWVSFVKAGAPRCGAEAWPKYDPKTDQLMEFGLSSGLRTNLRKTALDAAQQAEPAAR